MKKLYATHETGDIYQDENGKFFHVTPDGQEAEIEIKDGSDIAYSDIKSPMYFEADPETVQRFADLTEGQQQTVCAAHAKPLHTTAKNLLPIFQLGNPLIVAGQRSDGSAYCRIHADSVAVMKVLLKQYL